jgi:uncharacterized cupredoxin-like copper-binding protein
MRKLTTRPLPALVAVAVASLTLAQLASARTEWQTSAPATTVQIKGGEFFFRLSTKSIAKPGKVTFVFKNIGHVAHDFKINGKTTPLLQPGKTSRLVITFKKKAKYSYLCTVPGHAAAGMKGVFTVR